MSLHTFAAPSALSLQYVPLAQLVEYQTFNLGVAGSSPAWRTTKRILAKRDTSPVFFTPYTHTFPFPYQWGVRGSAPSICGSWLIAGSIPASRRVHFSFFSFLYPRPAVRHAAGRHTGYTDKLSSGASPESRISNT